MNRLILPKTVALFLVIGAFRGGTSIAQTPTQSLVLEVPQPSRGCPVSMHVQQKGLGDLLKVKISDGRPMSLSQAAQRIRLVLGRPNNELLDANSHPVDHSQAGTEVQKSEGQIVSARVTVTGTDTKGRAVPTVNSNQATSGKTKTLEASFVHSDGAAAANLLLDGFTSITSITLRSITYADGSIWSPSASSVCQTAPDPFMLVSATSQR